MRATAREGGRARTPRAAWVGGTLLALIVAGAVLRARVPEVAEPPRVVSLAERLVVELRGAYPEEAPEPSGERPFTLRAAPTTLALIDGRELEVWAYEGRVPGPVLRVPYGEALRVELVNDLPQATTIHWHGVRVPNAMDGVPGVTQPAVEPGERFVYRFTPKDPGTFWFHPHVRGSEQLERGLTGVLIVEDPEPLPYHRDVVWVVDDWLLGSDGQIFPEFNTRRDLAHDGRWGNFATVDGTTTTTLDVRAGERIRLRLVNVANGRVFAPDFSAFEAWVIAVDGMQTARPLDPRGFELAPGNRLDLDLVVPLELRGQTVEILDRFTRQPFRLAAIRVADDAVETPTFAPPTNPRVPPWRRALGAPVTARYVLGARRGGERGIEWTLNDKVWGEHETRRLPAGEFARLRFVNESARLHPMHLHGQFFKVLERDGQAVDEPFFRDTVLVHARETVDVGLVPLDAGQWLAHCHILEHAEAGMRTLVEVDSPRGTR